MSVPENPLRAAVAILRKEQLGSEGQLFMDAVDHALAERDELRVRCADLLASLTELVELNQALNRNDHQMAYINGEALGRAAATIARAKGAP